MDTSRRYTEALPASLSFLTDTEPIAGSIKGSPQDFVVKEITSPPPENPSGKFTIIDLELTNWETNRAIKTISKKLGVSRGRFGFAGTKDKRAVTRQLISIKGTNLDIERIQRIKDMEVLDHYHSTTGMKMGDLRGNHFSIRIKNCAPGDRERAQATIAAIEEAGGFPNYFGAQRFGTLRPVTHIVGEHIVRGDLAEAVRTYVANPFDSEPDDVKEARRIAEDPERYAQALKVFPVDYSFERSLLHYLVSNPGDYAGALDQLPKNLTLMFIHAYQGHIFNKILSERLSRGLPLEPILGDRVLPAGKDGLPEHGNGILATELNIKKLGKRAKQGNAFVSGLVVGTETEFAEGPQGEIEKEMVQQELGTLDTGCFIIPEIPRLTTKGIRRELLCPVQAPSVSEDGEGLVLKFGLNKGCYATTFLRELFKI